MDDLKFRRTVLADPNTKDAQVHVAIQQDAKKRDFLNELKQLDHKMSQAIQVPVPDDLAHRLVLRQTMTEHQSKNNKKNHFIQLTMAASIAFVFGILFNQWQFSSAVSLSEHGIAHVLHEGNYALEASEDISLQQVNAKLGRFGGEMTASVGRIYYANFCDFDNVKSLHLVMQGDSGRVSIFIVPHDKTYVTDNAVEGKWSSQSFDFSQASLIVVSDVPSDVINMKEKLAKSVRFSA